MTKPVKIHLIFTAAIAILIRVWLWFTYPISLGNDSDTYIHLGNSLRNNLGFARYNGTRTPGYPFLLALVKDLQNLYLVQLTLGVLTTLLVFMLVYRLAQNPIAATAAALFHTLNLQQLLFEGAVLSETLSTFLLILGLYLLQRYLEGGTNPGKFRFALLAGLAMAALASVRSLFLTLPFCFLLVFILWQGRTRSKNYAAGLAALLVPITLGLALWVGYVYLQFNVVGLDAMGGYHKVNHVSSFFEKAPTEYQQISEIFIKYRDARIELSGSAVNTIWDAIPDLMKATHLNYYALGRQMGEISDKLASQNPGLYWKNVGLAWLWFWKVGVVWQPGGFQDGLVRAMVDKALLFQRGVLILANMAFLLGSVIILVRRWFSRLPPLLWATTAFIWFTSFLQAIAEFGDNPRFLAPAQSLVIMILTVAIVVFLRDRKRGNANVEK